MVRTARRMIVLGVVLAVTGCAAMRGHPAATAPTAGTKLSEITGPSFEPGKARLTEAGQAQVDEVVRLLQQNPGLHVSIDGHTDASGGSKANQALSERRAQQVAHRLMEEGIAADRLSVRGFGESTPVARTVRWKLLPSGL